MSLSAHKCHGPTGFGVLYVRHPAELRPLLVGGGQQWGLRPGTESVGGALAVAASLQDANDPGNLANRLDTYAQWADAVWTALAPFVLAGWVVRTGPLPGPNRAAHHVSFCVRGFHGNGLCGHWTRRPGCSCPVGARAHRSPHCLLMCWRPCTYRRRSSTGRCASRLATRIRMQKSIVDSSPRWCSSLMRWPKATSVSGDD